jgi:hypothetical protein
MGVVSYYVEYFPDLVVKHDVWGQFGDFFGGILNPVFGFVSLILITVNLWVQDRNNQADKAMVLIGKLLDKIEKLFDKSAGENSNYKAKFVNPVACAIFEPLGTSPGEALNLCLKSKDSLGELQALIFAYDFIRNKYRGLVTKDADLLMVAYLGGKHCTAGIYAVVVFTELINDNSDLDRSYSQLLKDVLFNTSAIDEFHSAVEFANIAASEHVRIFKE